MERTCSRRKSHSESGYRTWPGADGLQLPAFFPALSVMALVYTASAARAAQLLPHRRMRVVEVMPGRCLVGLVAVEYRDQGVRCTVVLPSVIDTPANRAAPPDADYTRWVPPAQIADVIRFLAGPGSAPVSGATVPVYGRA